MKRLQSYINLNIGEGKMRQKRLKCVVQNKAFGISVNKRKK